MQGNFEKFYKVETNKEENRKTEYIKADRKKEDNKKVDSKNDKKKEESKTINKRVPDKKMPKIAKAGCQLCEQCGGCLGQEETYELHLERKQKQIEVMLGEFCKVDSIIGMKDPCHYRKRVHAVFGHDKIGTPISGVKDQVTNKTIQVNHCYLDDEKSTAIILSIKDLLKSFKIKTFDENTGHGLLRYVLVRNAIGTGELMVVLVLSSSIMPSKNNFVKALRKLHPEIDTILINENYKKTKVILGDKESTIYGKGFIKDQMGNKEFRVSAKSFYPINPVQAEQLYNKAIAYAQLEGHEIVLDAYCGIGTLGILASDYARKILSVDSNPNAIRDGVSNVKRNQIKNVDFYTNDAGALVTQIVESEKQAIDVVFMDPPKSGADQIFMDALVALDPKKVVYISRNLTDTVKDLRYLKQKGYKAVKAVGIDSAPWTYRVDCVILLTK